MRNRLRRRAREWVRMHVSSLPEPVDIALFFKKEAAQATKKEFYEDIANMFRQYTEK